MNPQKGNEPNDASNPPPVPQSPVQTIAVLANDAELGYVKPMPEASPQILLRLDAKSGEWRRLESRAKLKNGDRLQVLPGSFPEIVLSPGVLVAMGGPSQFRPVATSLPDQTGFTIDYGRIFVASTGVPGARIHLDLAGWRCIISIADAASDLAVEVQQYLPPGDDPEKAPRQRVVQVFCTAGRVQCEDAVSNTTTWLEKGQMKTIVGDRSQTAAARTIPSWVRREGLRDVERIAAASLNASLTADRTVALFLQERSHDRKPEVRSLVARCLVCLELYDAVLADLADEKQRDFWAADIDALRQSMSRRSESALRVREALERVNSAEASKLYRILWSYSPEQLREGGGAAELVTLLDHDSLMVRVLAFETLRRITGKDYLYRPGGSTSQRRTARMLWWGALQKGEVIYTTMPSPLWSEK